MKRPMIMAALACIGGVAVSWMTRIEVFQWMLVGLVLLIITHIVKTIGEYRLVLLLPVVFLLAFLQGSRYRVEEERMTQWIASQEQVTLSGTITWQSDGVFWLSNLKTDQGKQSGTLLCYDKELTGNHIGKRVEVSGTVREFSTATNPGQFDQKDYYLARKVYGSINVKEKEILGLETGWTLRRFLFYLRVSGSDIIQRLAGDQQKGIYLAILLGDKSELEDDIKNAFQSAGIMHILVVSGLHLSLLGSACYKILRKLFGVRSISILLSLLLMGGYAYITGSQSACMRAYIMFSLSMIAQLYGRTYDRISATALALILLLLEQPRQMLQSGFLLSFTSVLAIACVIPILEEAILPTNQKKQRKRWQQSLLDSAVFSAALPLATMPVTCWFFYRISSFGPLINLIALPMVPVLFVSLLAALIIYLITGSVMIAKIILKPADVITALFTEVGSMMEQQYYSMTCTGRPALYVILLYYMVLILFLWSCILQSRRKMKKERGRNCEFDENGVIQKPPNPFWKLLLLYTMVFLMPVIFTNRPKNDVEVIILDVGQGDGILIRTRDGRTCLIDGGSMSKNEIWKNIVSPALDYYGISHIDLWFLTHPDQDHISAFLEYQLTPRHKKVSYVILPKTTDVSEIWKKVLNQSNGRVTNNSFYAIAQGEKLSLGGLEFEAISPKETMSALTSEENDLSLVLLMKYQNHSILFCGDISQKQEVALLQDHKVPKADILKIAHHGSAYSSQEDFLKEVSPKWSLISVGKNNYGHPSQDVLDRLKKLEAEVYITYQNSAIIIEFSKLSRNIRFFR